MRIYFKKLKGVYIVTILLVMACLVSLHRQRVVIIPYERTLHQTDLNESQEVTTLAADTQLYSESRGQLGTKTSTTKLVLYWIKERNFFGLGLGSEPFSGCRFSNCVATANSSQLSQAAAVLFHGRAMQSDQLPPPRPPGQLWVFVQRECPLMVDVSFDRFDGLFNATMTYRSDSDIVYRYFEVMQISPADSVSSAGHVVERNFTQLRMAAWVVSNCNTTSKRDHYVKQLQQHLEVDIYGRCSPYSSRKQCPGDKNHKKQDSCYRHLAQRYLFYLAFENSFCKDYITEKMYKPLRFGMVPVVRGLSRQEYERLTPPDSFIHVDDFNSTADLAKYLYHLKHHPEEYSRYHAWRQTHQVQEPKKAALCRLCQLLHQQNLSLKHNGQVQQWWKNSSICWRPE